MLSQQMTSNTSDMSGQLVVTAPGPYLPELQALAVELSQREGMTTNGEIIILGPPEEPPTQG
jgi:hypothetical protein